MNNYTPRDSLALNRTDRETTEYDIQSWADQIQTKEYKIESMATSVLNRAKHEVSPTRPMNERELQIKDYISDIKSGLKHLESIKNGDLLKR